jgi:hypothetical protein
MIKHCSDCELRDKGPDDKPVCTHKVFEPTTLWDDPSAVQFIPDEHYGRPEWCPKTNWVLHEIRELCLSKKNEDFVDKAVLRFVNEILEKIEHA